MVDSENIKQYDYDNDTVQLKPIESIFMYTFKKTLTSRIPYILLNQRKITPHREKGARISQVFHSEYQEIPLHGKIYKHIISGKTSNNS